jgi:hypothetical protein
VSALCKLCDSPRVQRVGREVTFDGATIARCSDEAAAELIALAVTYVGLPQERIPAEANRRLAELTA